MTPQRMLFCLTVICTIIVFVGFNAILATIWYFHWHQPWSQAFFQWCIIDGITSVVLLGAYLLISI